MTEGFVLTPVGGWLRLEGGAVLVAAVGAYYLAGNSWVLFAVLFLAPDLSFLGYLAGPRFGAVAYNVAHTYVGPAVLALAATATGGSVAVPLIWAAHIGMDRLLGAQVPERVSGYAPRPDRTGIVVRRFAGRRGIEHFEPIDGWATTNGPKVSLSEHFEPIVGRA